MSTMVYSDLHRLKKIGGQWIFGGASNFSNLLAPWASGSRSLILRTGIIHRVILKELYISFSKRVVESTTDYTFTPCVGSFSPSGIDTR